MKLRSGFVSNSSSSSYILATKGEVTKEKLIALFQVPKESFLYSFAVQLADFFVPSEYSTTKMETLEDVVERYGWRGHTFEETLADNKEVVQLIKDGWTVYEGSSSNEGYGVSPWVCDEDFDFETEDLILRKEGGY